MVMNTSLAGVLVALGLSLGLSGTALAATPHGHGTHGVPALELRPNNGQKWQTDEALRTGMIKIRDALNASLPLMHAGRFSAAEFSALADKVQEQVDYVVANCKLPEEADLQLHVALTQVLDGITVMKGPSGQDQGAVAVVQALNAYGDYFDHPEWKPLGN